MKTSMPGEPCETRSMRLPPRIIPDDEGELIRLMGARITVKISGTQTDGAYALIDYDAPPGTAVPPHYHDREDEVFIVREGSVRVFANDRWCDVAAGGVVLAPRGHVHAFEVVAPEPCRFWLVVSLAGFEDFFRELATQIS